MISEALRLIRVFHGLKQGDLAEKLGISSSYLSEIEHGKKSPSLDLINQYAKIFHMPASSILFFSEKIEDAQSGEKFRVSIASKAISLLKMIEQQTRAEQP